MDRESELAIVRRAFAKQVAAAAQTSNPRIEAAFSAVRREDFMGPGPWPMFRFSDSYVNTPDADPVLLYVDQLFGLVPERRLNNGQPSLHAALLAAVNIGEGERVVHVGAGTGYYTAIMAYLAGPSGTVIGIECDASLAARARANLAPVPTASVVEGNGATMRLSATDVLYVNAGVTRLEDTWLDALSDGGRMIVPLTTDGNFPSSSSGAYFLIRRRGSEFEARGVLATAIIPAEGVRDKVSEAALAAAFVKKDWRSVTRLVRGGAEPDERCWLRGDGWSLVSD